MASIMRGRIGRAQSHKRVSGAITGPAAVHPAPRPLQLLEGQPRRRDQGRWGQRPISINLTRRKNFCCAKQLHWSSGPDHAQSACDGSATVKKMAQLHRGNYDRQEGVTRFQHQSPTTHCLATRIPRGKKSLPLVRPVPTIAPSIFWPASTPERIDHHSWERARHPTNSSVA